MTTKCTGLMGRIFGHLWKRVRWTVVKGFCICEYHQCQRCGAVTGEKK